MSGTHRYGPTAARKEGRPGRELRPSTTTIDIHAHVSVPAAQAVVAPHLDPKTIPLAHFATAFMAGGPHAAREYWIAGAVR